MPVAGGVTAVGRLLDCRRWRREQDLVLKKLRMNEIMTSGRCDRIDLATLFGEDAMTAIVQFAETTEVGRKRTEGTDEYDSWDICRTDRDGIEEMTGIGGEVWG
jgi:hypothetical protein